MVDDSDMASWKKVLVVRPHPGQAVTIGVKSTQAHGLEHLLRDQDFLRPLAARLGRQGNADRIANAFLEQHGHRRRRGNNPLRAHAGLGQTEMQRIVGTTRQPR